MTAQETDLRFPLLQSVTIRSTTRFEASYAPTPQAAPAADGAATTSPPPARKTPSAPRQRQLFD
jgi:hypothetical protein